MESDEAGKSVDLSGDDSLRVNIADALNEQDVVKFSVHTKTTLDRFKKRDFQVQRQHEEFVWLHDRFVECEDYAGFLIPPCPPKPDFSQSHGKLAKLQAGDSTMLDAELEKLKQEIQSEYLAAFQKTVAMHEVFLMRLVSHPVLREDENLKVFLEYDKPIDGKMKSRKDKAVSFLKNTVKNFDSTLDKFRDTDEFFDENRAFILHYNTMVKDAQEKAEKKVKKRDGLISQMGKVSTELTHTGSSQTDVLADVLRKVGEAHEKAQTVQKKLSAKEDLKMTDLLRYYVADGLAAKDLMLRRIKAYQSQESTARALDAARAKQKKVQEAEQEATEAKATFESITKAAKEELVVFKKRRSAAFRKGLVQYAQCQIRQGRDELTIWKDTLAELKTIIEG